MDPRPDVLCWSPVEQLLAAHAKRDPHRVAVVDVDRDGSISFAELDALVEGVALQLQALGVAPRRRVALLIDAGIETIAV
ncbi:MAG: hypothetical protein EOO21_00910, partial [Comamonadaceae bacterium]